MKRVRRRTEAWTGMHGVHGGKAELDRQGAQHMECSTPVEGVARRKTRPDPAFCLRLGGLVQHDWCPGRAAVGLSPTSDSRMKRCVCRRTSWVYAPARPGGRAGETNSFRLAPRVSQDSSRRSLACFRAKPQPSSFCSSSPTISPSLRHCTLSDALLRLSS